MNCRFVRAPGFKIRDVCPKILNRCGFFPLFRTLNTTVKPRGSVGVPTSAYLSVSTTPTWYGTPGGVVVATAAEANANEATATTIDRCTFIGRTASRSGYLAI